MKKIILASGSPRRKEILENLGLEFKVVPSNYEEDMTLDLPPMELAKFLAKGKAEDVAKDYKDHLIIAADTFVVLDNELLGKPHSEEEARVMLKKISNKELLVITGLSIIDTGDNKSISQAVETKMYIKELSDSEINNYIKTKEPLDKAGAFAVQGIGSVIIKKVEGDFFNSVGLPAYDLAQHLKDFGVDII